MLPFQIVCYRLICIAILNFVKIEKIIFMILTHLAFRNCLTTSRCIVISTICSVPRYIYTGDQNVWVFAIFISEMAFSIRTSHLVFQYFAILDKNILWDLVETTILEPKPVNIQNILVSSVKQPWQHSPFCDRYFALLKSHILMKVDGNSRSFNHSIY